MNKAVFLDRDGVINEDGRYIYRIDDFKFKDGIFEFCRAAQEKGYLLIVVTNQSGIARGYYTEEDFLKLNEWMCGKFREEGIMIRKVYYCPYHPTKGIGKYKVDSYDRKPNPGMLERAAKEFDIDLKHSVVIGDKDSDMQAGRAASVGKLVLLPGAYEYGTADDITIYDSIIQAIDCLELL